MSEELLDCPNCGEKINDRVSFGGLLYHDYISCCMEAFPSILEEKNKAESELVFEKSCSDHLAENWGEAEERYAELNSKLAASESKLKEMTEIARECITELENIRNAKPHTWADYEFDDRPHQFVGWAQNRAKQASVNALARLEKSASTTDPAETQNQGK